MASARALILLALLGGCQAQAEGPSADVAASVRAGDTRIIVRAGRGQMAPGIPAELQAEAKARCGVRTLEGLGDVVRPEQREAYNKRLAYAVEYNRLMLSHCPVAK
ncbi:hypothetical protein [Aeromonas diversa]|uniref:hypothetical protein n=1 Tax=Aeromonas diversa TaxID=502790 RepID=UPI0034631518